MLLDDIITLLSNRSSSLEDALLKMKVLLNEIDHSELVPWVNKELGGYDDTDQLPAYRIVSSQPHGSLTDIAWEYGDQVLPTGHLTDAQKKIVRETKVTSPIGAIEQQVAKYREKGQGLIRRLPPELIPGFQKGLAKGVNILKLWTEVNMADMESIPVQVRSRLLDFCLELQKAVGRQAPTEQLQEKAREFDTGQMFTRHVYHIQAGTFILGNQTIQINNQPGDIDGLLGEIKKLGYENEQLDELRKAVLDDRAKGETPTVTEGETSKWYMKALKKIGKGAVDVTVDVATGVIVKALEHYSKGG